MPVPEELLNQLRQRLDVPNIARVSLAEEVDGRSLRITIYFFNHRHPEEAAYTYARILTQDSNAKVAFKKMFKTMVEVTDMCLSAFGKAKQNVKELRKDIMGMRGLQSLIITANASERLRTLEQYLEDAEAGGAPRSDYRAVIQEARMIAENE